MTSRELETANVLLTGFRRHSLGEAIVGHLTESTIIGKLFGIDQELNEDLSPPFRQIALNINPLNLSGGVEELQASLRLNLQESECPFSCLIHTAGAYDYGDFLEHDVSRRQRLLGVNVLGTVEVLQAVMSLNARRGYVNERDFTLILIGSFQALNPRSRRSIYAASKSFGLDLCTGLDAGDEVARCLYVAVGPMDTSMLHWNHWVRKAGGSADYFNRIFSGNRALYESIFVNCEESSLERVAEEYAEKTSDELRETFERYCATRREQIDAELGVLDRRGCASLVANLTQQSEKFKSGVYFVSADREGNPVVRMCLFSDLNRRTLFDQSCDMIAV